MLLCDLIRGMYRAGVNHGLDDGEVRILYP